MGPARPGAHQTGRKDAGCLIEEFFAVFFGTIFGDFSGAVLAAKWLQKWLQNGSKICYFLDTLSVPCFLRSWSSVGASWEPSWASKGSLRRPLDSKNLKKPKVFLGFLQRPLFSVLEALDGPREPLWRLLGAISS